MKEKITVFYAKSNNSKIPISKFGDNTFVFETFEVKSHIVLFDILVSNFILNIPLNLSKPIRTFRRKKNLERFLVEKLSYFILDIDDIKTLENQQHIINHFKSYKTIIGKSRSNNGIDNFNLKGIIFIEPTTLADAKRGISLLNHELRKWCNVDECSVRTATLNAPILKNDIILNNEKGSLYKFSVQEDSIYINEVKQEYIKQDIGFNSSDIRDIRRLSSIEADSIDKLCLKSFQSMGFIAIRTNPNGSITFKHPNEKKSPGGYFWFGASPYTMHHGNSTKTINIFDIIRKLPQAKELMSANINYEDEFQQFNVDTNVISVQEKYLTVTPKIEQTITSFITEPNGLLSIRSPMGTGKSTIIGHCIEECNNQDMTVLIITNRISVAQDFGKKYNLKVYNVDKYDIGDSLVCQYDSLWKYNLKFFDVIVMDEFISLMMHTRSNLNNSSINIAKFFGSFNKKLIIADAFLTGYENFLLEHKKNNIHMIDNTYRDPTILYSYNDFNQFISSLSYHAQKQKCTISATSLSFIHSTQLLLENKGLKVATLTADTPNSTKELIYGLFEKEDHDKWDVLIYSPTLTVGVSNLNNCMYHFHYDSSRSTDVVSSIQMIKRTRKTREIHMFIKERTNYIKTTYNSIRDEYMNNIGKNVEQNYLFEIDDYGECRLSNIGKKAIKIDTFKNILEFNHKEATFWLLKYHFIHEPRLVEKKFDGNILLKYSKKLKQDKCNLIRSNIEQYLELNDFEKTEILLNSDADKTMRSIAEIDEHIKPCEMNIKTKILECSISDRSFLEKCKYYKKTFNYTKKIWNDSDIQYLISKSVMKHESSDLHFYTLLLKYGQKEIFDSYVPKHINANKDLKTILDKCGYSLQTKSNRTAVANREYTISQNIKDLSEYVI